MAERASSSTNLRRMAVFGLLGSIAFTVYSYSTMNTRAVFVSSYGARTRTPHHSTTFFPASEESTPSYFQDYVTHAGVRCSHLLKGNTKAIAKAHAFVIRNQEVFKDRDDHELLNVTCKGLKAAGYSLSPASAEEQAFPIAYGLRLHQCAMQAELLLRAIYAPQNVYCIHVDKHADAVVIAAMRHVASCIPNIHILPSEYFVYASMSQLRVDLKCMRALLKSPVQWRYFINVAGQELPLRTNYEMVKILQNYNGSNEIQSIFAPWYSNRYNHSVWCRSPNHGTISKCKHPLIAKAPPPENVTIYKGLAYSFFSRAFVEYVLDKNGLPARLYSWFNDTWAPEEHYFATIARQEGAPGGFRKSKHLLPTSRVVVWEKRDGRKHCRGKFVRDVCVFGVRDLLWLRKQPEAFANKFRADYDPLALHCLAEHVLKKGQSRASVTRINMTL